MLFIYFHAVSIVQVQSGKAEELVDSFASTAEQVDAGLASLSPLLSEALRLLDQASHPLYGPMPAMAEVAQELRADGRDLRERLDIIYESENNFDGPSLAELNALIAGWNGTDNDPRLDELLRERRERLEELFGQPAHELDPHVAAVAEEYGLSYEEAERAVAGAELAELNTAIENWNGTDNDPRLDEMLRERRELVALLGDGAEVWEVDPKLVAIAAMNLVSYEEADFAVTTSSIDDLTANIDGWTGHPNDPNYNVMLVELGEQIDRLAEGNPELAAQIRGRVNAGIPASDALFDSAVEVFGDSSLTALMDQINERNADPETFDPIAMAMHTALLANVEDFTDADAAEVNWGIAAMAQENDLTYNGAVAMLNHQIASGNSEFPPDTEPFEFLDGPIGSGQEAAFRMLANREAFDEIEHANGGWLGPDGKMSNGDWEKVLANPGDFSADAVAIATFFSANPDAWRQFDTARDGVALSGLANGEYGVSNGDDTTSWADVEQYVTNIALFDALSAEMEINSGFLQDLDGDGHLDTDEFEAALNLLESDNPNYAGLQEALQFAIDTDLMDLPDNRSFVGKIGDGAYTISSLMPGSPTNIYRMVTEPGDLLGDYGSFAKGAGNTVVAVGQMAYDVSAMSPLGPTFYLEAWRVDGDMEQHRGMQMARAVPQIVDAVASLDPSKPQFWTELAEVRQSGTWDSHDGANLAMSTLDWETFVENPAEWAGQFAPEVLITIATGGGGSVTKIGTTATRMANTARRATTAVRRMPTGWVDPSDLRLIANQKLDDLALTLFPQPNLRPAWADNVHLASRMDDVPVRSQWVNGGRLPKRVPEGIARQRIAAELKGWRPAEVIVGSKRIRITKERMEHFLKRHSPDHWHTRPKENQSFFPNKWGVDEIEAAIREALKQNRDLIDSASDEPLRFTGTINGRPYVATIDGGDIVQFFLE